MVVHFMVLLTRISRSRHYVQKLRGQGDIWVETDSDAYEMRPGLRMVRWPSANKRPRKGVYAIFRLPDDQAYI